MMAAALAYGRIASAMLNHGVTVLCWRIAQATARSTSFREARWLLYARIPNRSAYMNISERITMNPEICTVSQRFAVSDIPLNLFSNY
jgi:hypothetical protein